MKNHISLLFIFITVLRVFSQNSFEYTFTKYPSCCYSAFESDNYEYVVGYKKSDSIGYNAFIMRFTDGNDLVIKEIIKQDTNTSFYFGINKENGVNLIVGKKNEQLYICIMNEQLDILNEYYYSIIPEGYQSIYLYDMIIDHDDNIVLAGHFEDNEPGDVHSLVLIKLNQEGELIEINNLVSIWYSGYEWGEIMSLQDASGYYYFGGGSFDWIKIDSNFQFVTGNSFYPNFIGTNVTSKYLPNGNIAFVGMQSDLNIFYDITLNITTADLQWIYDSVLVEPGRQSPAIFKGMDYIDPENIWVVAFNDWIAPTGTEIYKFYIFDSEFNVKGSKYYGGDNDYTFTYLKATNDGGCVVSGMIRREVGSLSRGGIIIKVMPEDILTSDDEKVFTDFKDVLVYPNPFTDKILLTSDRNDLIFNLFNSQGQLVYQGAITERIMNEINVGNLSKGIYIYSISNATGRAIDGGKLIKK